MTIEQIADRLTGLCKQGQYETAQRELYAHDAISIEPEHAPGLKTVAGLDHIIEKGHQFQGMIEALHSNTVTGPIIAGNYFSVAAVIDVTLKGMGRSTMTEIAVYKVDGGKIVSEQFIY
jgi:hypothetical protein